MLRQKLQLNSEESKTRHSQGLGLKVCGYALLTIFFLERYY